MRSIAEDAEGHLWFGVYGGGLARFDPFTEHFTRYAYDERDKYSLPNDEVYKVYPDSKNRIWVATIGGVAWCSVRDSVFHRTYSKPIYDIHEDKQGVLWVFTKNGLQLIENKNNQWTISEPFLLPNQHPNWHL